MKDQPVLTLFNTESRKKEIFKPIQPPAVRLYTCGPTVYNFAHIGNFRTYVFEDLLRRTLQFFGYKVIQVMNITDVDDKTIKGALEKSCPLTDFTEPYTQAFFEDLKTLNIQPAEHYPKATDYIPEMIKIIERLLEKEVAYKGADGSIYFSIAKFPNYGRLSHLHMDELKAGASGITTDEYDKQNISDFVLWKIYDPSRDGFIYWESPFGKGRPGWHIECSAMSMKLLGESFDIHVGGVDNMFPHHENEIAQSEAYSNKKFVRYWLHSEHLLVDHKKMSKSLGNFYTLRDLLSKGYKGPEIRYMLIQAHYHTQLNFTFKELDAIVTSYQRLADFITRLKDIDQKAKGKSLDPLIAKCRQHFTEALADDLNIAPALGALFDFVRDVNHQCDQQQVDKEESAKAIHWLQMMDQVLGFLPLTQEELIIPQDLFDALEKRNRARTEKNWKEADKQRDYIQSKGYVIEDAPHGSRLKPLRKTS